jgi:3'-5' exoribonuclease
VTFSIHDKYGQQIEIHRLRPVTAEDRETGFELANLIESSRFSIPEMWQELLGLVEREIACEPVRQLVLTIYQKHAQALQELPATDSKFYPFRGGWLEHVLSLTKACTLLVDHYRKQYEGIEPGLDRDLVLAGALLHDIGRVLEFKTDPLGNITAPTVPGRLYGHVMLGRDLVRQTALEMGNVPPEFLERLEHLILSHLVHPEWGSQRLPLIPEVLILHHADDLDAKLEMYLRCLSRDQTTGPFTLRDSVLGKPLLKPGAWPEHR